MSDNPLLAIFSSRTIVRLLSLFLLNPDRSYYQQELTRETGGSLRPVQMALDKLSAAGLVSRRREGKQVYYQAVPSNPVFGDLQSLFKKTFALHDVLAEALGPVNGIDLAFVYGSVASGTQGVSSDVDLFIVGSAGRMALSEALAEAETTLKREINVSLFTPERLTVALTHRDPFVKSVLNSPHLWIRGGDDDLERLAL